MSTIVTVGLSLDELVAIQAAMETVDMEYGFSVYRNARSIPTGSHGPRTPEDHSEAAARGQRLMGVFQRLIESVDD